jgi:hypothetical protein
MPPRPKRIATKRNLPRVGQGTRINIFISYASEDRDLANSIYNLLIETFPFAPLFIYRDVEIRQGKDYAAAIDKALDRTDILLVIFTERMKMSHSYTGYEVGYFNRSKQQHSIGAAGFERIYIPFCIGAEIPDSLHFIEGVTVDKDEIYRVLKTKVESGVELAIGKDHVVFKFLARISDLLMQMVSTADSDFGGTARQVNLSAPASQLYRIIHEYLQGRISSETYPERKLVIRTSKRPTIGRDGAELDDARIELVGDFSEIFNVSVMQSLGQEYSWPEFCENVPSELQTSVLSGIRMLTAQVLKGTGENYHVVTSVRRDKAFRLFVSKVVTYVSQKTEIHVYIVQMRTKEYGDPLTSRLLKAISAGLRFRFLLLEEQSEFRPEKLGHPIVSATDLKAKIVEMLGQIDLILRDAVDADLEEAEILILIWGRGQEAKVQAMMEVWEKSRQALYAAADAILNSTDESAFRSEKQDFINALTTFCANVEEMNREFTSRVLWLLAEQVKGTIGVAQPERTSAE